MSSEVFKTTVAIDNREILESLIFQNLQKKAPVDSLAASDIQQQQAEHIEKSKQLAPSIQAQLAVLFLTKTDRVITDFFTYKRLQSFAKTGADPAIAAVIDTESAQRLASLHECIILGGMKKFQLKDIFSNNPYAEKKLWLDLLFYTAANRDLPLRCRFTVSIQDLEQEESFAKKVNRVSPIAELEEALHMRLRAGKELTPIVLEPFFETEALQPQHKEPLSSFLKRLDAVPNSFLALDQQLGSLLDEPRVWIWRSPHASISGINNLLPKFSSDDRIGILAGKKVWEDLVAHLLEGNFDETIQMLSKLTDSGGNLPRPNPQNGLEHLHPPQPHQTKKEAKQRV